MCVSFVPVKSSAKVESSQPQQPAKADESSIEVAFLGMERRPAPSLAELDSSSSFSSMEEDIDSDSDPESISQTQTRFYSRPPLVRSRGRGGLHRMSEAFVCFFAPDKRLTRLVEELSRDRRSTFGSMVQDFLLAQREVLKSLASSSSGSSSSRVTSVQLLQGLRHFLSQAKCCLMDCGELEPPIDTLVPENEKGKRTKSECHCTVLLISKLNTLNKNHSSFSALFFLKFRKKNRYFCVYIHIFVIILHQHITSQCFILFFMYLFLNYTTYDACV